MKIGRNNNYFENFNDGLKKHLPQIVDIHTYKSCDNHFVPVM